MIQDVRTDKDALVVNFDEKRIREDLRNKEKLKVPADEIYIPKVEEILFTIGSQWKQRYIIEKEGELYISPVQYNVDTGRFVNYHEHDWQKRPWLKKCGGCHATGVDLEKKNFVEPGVGCEACHGKGSWHAILPKAKVYQKRETIVNPAKLTMGVSVQICGSCHNRPPASKVQAGRWVMSPARPSRPITSPPPSRPETSSMSTPMSSPRDTTSNISTGGSPSTTRKA
jgi:hypothetical protein